MRRLTMPFLLAGVALLSACGEDTESYCQYSKFSFYPRTGNELVVEATDLVFIDHEGDDLRLTFASDTEEQNSIVATDPDGDGVFEPAPGSVLWREIDGLMCVFELTRGRIEYGDYQLSMKLRGHAQGSPAELFWYNFNIEDENGLKTSLHAAPVYRTDFGRGKSSPHWNRTPPRIAAAPWTRPMNAN